MLVPAITLISTKQASQISCEHDHVQKTIHFFQSIVTKITVNSIGRSVYQVLPGIILTLVSHATLAQKKAKIIKHGDKRQRTSKGGPDNSVP